ncbi:MAG TPA: hypothetical protein P5277_01690 [Candidatus Paceibacterota bacterium]|nr:hypothetical protein [Candidatus Paceibacterota bacterium]
MVKKGGKFYFVIVLIFSIITLIFPFVSADIFLAKSPESTYNLGDVMSVVLGSDGSEGWASVDLACSNESKMIYFRYLTDEQAIEILTPFNKEFLRSMLGDCILKLSFNGKQKDSLPFFISDVLDVSVYTEITEFNPGETVVFSGSVTKPNGKIVNSATVDLKFTSINLGTIVEVNEGSFSGSFVLPENLKSGSYEFSVFASEKDSLGDVTNYGESKNSITIKQMPTILNISSSEKAIPGNNFDFSSLLYDQIGEIINSKVVDYTITDINDTIILSRLSNVGDNGVLSLPKNAPFGAWKIIAESEGINNEKIFYVEKNMEATFELIDGTLKITNVGNIPYTRKIEMNIGNETNVTYVNLSLGKSVEFKLSAPSGVYDIGVNDGTKSENWSGVSLTGNAISFGTSKKGAIGFFNRSAFVWGFLITLLLLFAIVLGTKKYMNKNYYFNSKDKNSNISKKQVMPIISTPSVSKNGGIVKITSENDRKPGIEIDNGFLTYSPTIDGVRQVAAIIAIKIKNYSEIKQNPGMTEEYLKKLSESIINNKGKVYKVNDSIIGVFTSSYTKSSDNEMIAIKTAKRISEILKDYNSKFSQKIIFGIGLNTGEVIIKPDNGKLLFNGIGNVLTNAKRVAELSDNELLLSEDFQRKVSSRVRTTLNEVGSGIIKTYKLNEIISRNENSQFIESFLKRNQEYNSLRAYRSERPNTIRTPSPITPVADKPFKTTISPQSYPNERSIVTKEDFQKGHAGYSSKTENNPAKKSAIDW